jgi:predicted metalloendopeptidase
MFNSNEWLDEETKKKAIEKLEHIIENAGYADWLLNNTVLLQEYDFVKPFKPNATFESAMYMRTYMSRRSHIKVYQKVDKSKEWPMGPAVVNAAYEPTQNSITIPAGILNLPFFNGSRPGYLNYGAMGAVIGHEITHGFDDEGSQYDLIGNLKNWWTDKAKNRFLNRTQCFIDQYSAVLDDRVNMHLNGKNTVGENLADNGGLRAAFLAYALHVKETGADQDLPGLEEFTPEQLFFMSYANNWCTRQRDEALRQSILYDPHSPPKYRTNVVLSNFDPFGKAFGCKRGDPMFPDPQKQCHLW